MIESAIEVGGGGGVSLYATVLLNRGHNETCSRLGLIKLGTYKTNQGILDKCTRACIN